MSENFTELINKFKEINKKGYIKGISNNLTNAAGITFESLIAKKADGTNFPDYKDIEIKTTQYFSEYPIKLFSTSFLGPDIFESNTLLEKYGWRGVKDPNRRYLITNLELNRKIKVRKVYFELKMDEKENMLWIDVYDENNNFIEKRGMVDLDIIKIKLYLKLRNLAVVYAKKIQKDQNLYFNYYDMICYTLKDFKTFINLIKTGIVKIDIQLRKLKTQEGKLKSKSKNLEFSISKRQLTYLYDEIYHFDKEKCKVKSMP